MTLEQAAVAAAIALWAALTTGGSAAFWWIVGELKRRDEQWEKRYGTCIDDNKEFALSVNTLTGSVSNITVSITELAESHRKAESRKNDVLGEMRTVREQILEIHRRMDTLGVRKAPPGA